MVYTLNQLLEYMKFNILSRSGSLKTHTIGAFFDVRSMRSSKRIFRLHVLLRPRLETLRGLGRQGITGVSYTGNL